jgi:8-oxo-dGTP pyrophosphatase MutT (NUDIX family)
MVQTPTRPPTRPPFNPHHAQIIAAPDLLAVPHEALRPDALRQRFQQTLAWQPEVHLERSLQFARRTRDSLVPAAVLMPLVIRESGLQLMFTQRAAHLHDHPGQISFPGGRYEASDVDLIATALRETEEEIGITATHIEVLGCLPDYETATGYQVTPVVGLVQPTFSLQTDSVEVAEVFEVPLTFLMNPAHHQLREMQLPEAWGGETRRFFAMPWQAVTGHEYFIWGATAGMLRNLYRYLIPVDDPRT